MTSKSDSKELFDKVVGIRMTSAMRDKYKALSKKSNCRSIGEFLRRALEKQKIVLYHKDASMESIAVELAGIRKELHAIGNNINQATHALHAADMPTQKLYHARQIADQYSKVTPKIETLFSLITNVHKKWSQKS